MSETPNKRQRLTGSFSPASPPYHLAKTSDQTKTPIVHPNTPTSPPYMSSALHPNGAPPSNATATFSEMTPPSSVPTSQHISHSAASTNNAYPIPTPANSTSGAMSSENRDTDGDALMTDDSNDSSSKPAEGSSASEANEHRRSDHDRQTTGLQGDFGLQSASGASLYKLCESPHTMSQPHASQNLIELYGLNSIQDSVARWTTDFEKKPLRKSYAGKLKELQLAGKPKVSVKEPGYLTNRLGWSDEDYYNQCQHGKEVEKGLGAELMGMLDQALSMAPGPLPASETNKWKAYMNLDDGSKAKGGPEGAGKKSVQPTPNVRTPAVPSPAMKPARPERQGTKRRYNDNSFSGYGEGFVDDDSEAATGEEDGRGGFGKKKRRKDYAASSPFGLQRGGLQMGTVGGRR